MRITLTRFRQKRYIDIDAESSLSEDDLHGFYGRTLTDGEMEELSEYLDQLEEKVDEQLDNEIAIAMTQFRFKHSN